jgi:tetratricopeptide (TPR) repeat protein
MVKGLSGYAATSGARRVVEGLRKRQTPQGRDVLKATHTAFIRSVRLMAEACSVSGGEAKDQYSARALLELVNDREFTSFDVRASTLPKREIDQHIRAIFEGTHIDPSLNATEAVIAEIEKRTNLPLTDSHRSLFRIGSSKHLNWPQAFELFFAEEVKGNERVFRSLAFDRLNEIASFAQQHQYDLSVLHRELKSFQQDMYGCFDRLEMIVAQQAGVPLLTMQAISQAFGELQPRADGSAIESYLLDKAAEYHRYRERAEAIDVQDSRSRILLGQAQGAIDCGDFGRADSLIAESERYDLNISAELRVSADKHDASRSAKRALRGDTARLQGDFPTAIAHYDAAAAMLPKVRREERLARRMAAAGAATEWGSRLGEPKALTDAIRRWRRLLRATDKDLSPVQWAGFQKNLGMALRVKGERQKGTKMLEDAVAAQRLALSVYSRKETPMDWASAHFEKGTALVKLGERQEGLAMLRAAVSSYKETLKVYTREALPRRWAKSRNNMALVYWEIGKRGRGTRLFRKSAAILYESLDMFDRTEVPMEWASAQNNLGAVLKTLGERQKGQGALRDAIAAYRAALEVRSRLQFPLDWAMTQNNIGNAFRLLAYRTKGTRDLEEAILAHEAALQVRTKDRLPLQWAVTTLSKVLAQSMLASRLRNLDQLPKLRAEARTARRLLARAGHTPWMQWGDHVLEEIDRFDASGVTEQGLPLTSSEGRRRRR